MITDTEAMATTTMGIARTGTTILEMRAVETVIKGEDRQIAGDRAGIIY